MLCSADRIHSRFARLLSEEGQAGKRRFLSLHYSRSPSSPVTHKGNQPNTRCPFSLPEESVALNNHNAAKFVIDPILRLLRSRALIIDLQRPLCSIRD